MDGLHYAEADGTRSDEITIPQAQALVADGTITDTTLVWTEGMREWLPFSECRHNFAGLDNPDDPEALYTTLHYETQDGPSDEVTVAQLVTLLIDGAVTMETQVWNEHMDSWTALAEVRHLFAGLDDGVTTGVASTAPPESEASSELLTSLYFELSPDERSEETSVSFAAHLAEEGDITAVTNVWAEGWDRWSPLGKCQHMFAVLCNVQLQPGPQATAEDEVDRHEEDEDPALAEGIPGMVKGFHYQVSEHEQSDEIPVSAVTAMLADGTLTKSTLIWVEGMGDWTPLSECTDILDGLAAALGDGGAMTLMYEKDGETPEVSLDEAEALISTGALTTETLVWTEGFHNWTILGECADTFPGLMDALAAAASTPVALTTDKAGGSGSKSASETSTSVVAAVDATSQIQKDAGQTFAMPDAFYYVTAAGRHSARVPVTRVPLLLKSETLSLDSMIWAEGMDRWYKLRDCKSKFTGLERILNQLDRTSSGSVSSANRKEQIGSLPEKRQLYAVLVKKIVSGVATAADTIQAEQLGAELEDLECETEVAQDSSVQGSVLVLSKLPIFEPLTEDQCRVVAQSMERCEYEPGDVICEEGDYGDFFYIVEHGGVKAVKHRGTGDETLLQEIDRGGCFGELALLTRQPRAASCVATAKDTKLLRVSRVSFDRALGPMVKLIKKGMEQAGAYAQPEPQNLVGACLFGSLQKVEEFLASEQPIGGAGAIVDPANRITLLHLTASLGHVDVVRFLLKNRAQVDGPSKAGATALHMAAREGRAQVVQLLCHSHAMVSAKTGVGRATPLFLAAQSGHVNSMNILIKHRADPSMGCGDSNATPLHIAAERGHFDVVTYLLSTGTRADVNVTDDDGATALHYAAAYGNTSVVWRLLERGAQPNKLMPNGANAFFLAAQNGHVAVLQLLLSLPGVDPHAQVTNMNGEQVSALDVAKQRGQSEIVALVEKLMGSAVTGLSAGKRAEKIDALRKDATFAGEAKPRLKAIREQPVRKGPTRSQSDNAHAGQLKKGTIVEIQEQRKDERGVLRMSIVVVGGKQLKGWVRNSDAKGSLFENCPQDP